MVSGCSQIRELKVQTSSRKKFKKEYGDHDQTMRTDGICSRQDAETPSQAAEMKENMTGREVVNAAVQVHRELGGELGKP